jgi:hypothetical protein
MPAHSNARSRTWTRRTALPAQAPGGQRSGASCSARLPAPPLAREQLTSRLDSCRTTCSPLTRYAVPRRRGQDVLTGELHVVDQRRFVEAVRRPARRHLVLPRPRRRLDPRRTKTPHRRMALPRLVSFLGAWSVTAPRTTAIVPPVTCHCVICLGRPAGRDAAS